MTIGEDRAPDAIEPITAYRAWSADRDGSLSSLNGESTWPPGLWLHARCTRRKHTAPRKGCSCGLYAAKELSDLLRLAALTFEWGPVDERAQVEIVGRVHLAGKVIEHDFGYRAEQARIAEILPLPGLDAWTEAVSRRYDVPVGESIPESAIPKVSEILGGLGCPPTGTSAPAPLRFPWASLWCLVWSLFFLVNAVRGILMDGGPHWSEWWLWPIALASGLVAAPSFLLFCVVMAALCLGERRAAARPLHGRSVDGPPRPIPDRPRPY